MPAPDWGFPEDDSGLPPMVWRGDVQGPWLLPRTDIFQPGAMLDLSQVDDRRFDPSPLYVPPMLAPWGPNPYPGKDNDPAPQGIAATITPELIEMLFQMYMDFQQQQGGLASPLPPEALKMPRDPMLGSYDTPIQNPGPMDVPLEYSGGKQTSYPSAPPPMLAPVDPRIANSMLQNRGY